MIILLSVIYYNIPFLHALCAKASISGTSIEPRTLPSSAASMTASATTSADKGFMAPAPIIVDKTPPKFTDERTLPAAAIGKVKAREESYSKVALIKILLIEGKCFDIVDSAARFVVM